MTRYLFIMATLPVWVVIGLLTVTGCYTSANPDIAYWTATVTTAFVVYMLGGQMARSQNIGFSPWGSTFFVLGAFLIYSAIGHYYNPTIGCLFSYLFPLSLMIIKGKGE